VAPPEHGQASDPGLRDLAARLLVDIDDFSARIAQQIQTKVPYYESDENVRLDELKRSCRANSQFVLQSLVDPEALTEDNVAAARDTGRVRAESGTPLAYVMSAFRVGFRHIWDTFVREARAHGSVRQDALVDAASEIWAAHDTYTDAMAGAYRETLLAQVVRDERERSALVAALLEGRVLDETTRWEVADVLRLPQRGAYVVVAAEAAHLGQEALPEVEKRLQESSIPSAWRLQPDLHVGIVSAPEESYLAALRTTLAAVTQARVGISPPYPELTGTAEALRLARMALASRPPNQAIVTDFDDVPLTIAAVSAPDVVDRMVSNVFHHMLELSEADRSVLLDTLSAWRDNSGSATAAARQLFCHPNTIRHRLRRIEKLTGRSLSEPRDVAELLVALESAHLTPLGARSENSLLDRAIVRHQQVETGRRTPRT
jgi:hypothetical protein